MILSPAARRARPVSVMSTTHVDDVGDLRLGGAVGQLDVGLDAVALEVPPGELGVLRRHPHPCGRSAALLYGESCGHGEHDAHRVRRGLGVLQLPQRHDLGRGLLDPVAPGDAEVEQAVGHVARDLLGAEDADVVDARVVDGGLVVDRRAALDRQVRGIEELEGGLLEGTLGENEVEHRPRLGRRTRHRARVCAGPWAR